MSHLPLISLQQVNKTFSGDLLDYGQLILKNINLNIYENEFVIILGPSGSGKSTLLNLIAGLEQPSTGKVFVRGRDLSEFNNQELAEYHRLNMGMVFQSFNLIKSLRVWENVALPQTAAGIRYKARWRRAKQLLDIFGLGQYMNRHPNELSGGEQQRVAIARALINNPYFLLVDEPTGNLDTKSAEDVMQILSGLHYYSDHTIILVTHNPDYMHYATRIIFLQDGQIANERQNDERHALTMNPAFSPEAHQALSGYRGQANETELQERMRVEYSPVLFSDYTASTALPSGNPAPVTPSSASAPVPPPAQAMPPQPPTPRQVPVQQIPEAH